MNDQVIAKCKIPTDKGRNREDPCTGGDEQRASSGSLRSEASWPEQPQELSPTPQQKMSNDVHENVGEGDECTSCVHGYNPAAMADVERDASPGHDQYNAVHEPVQEYVDRRPAGFADRRR